MLMKTRKISQYKKKKHKRKQKDTNENNQNKKIIDKSHNSIKKRKIKEKEK